MGKYWDGRLDTISKGRLGSGLATMELAQLPEHVREWAEQEDNYAIIPNAFLTSDGDTWTPICCVPFCCFWGRYHVLSDHVWHAMKQMAKPRHASEGPSTMQPPVQQSLSRSVECQTD